jgi:hypothetical protein
MQYDIIAVDMFNVFYKVEHNSLDKDPISIARNMVTFINDNVRKHLADKGKLFLLYDPIPKNDLGISKTFKYTERQDILYAYKRNRTHNRKCLTVVDTVRKYFSHRGPNIITVISNKYEADDFMETIIKEYKGKDIAMVTTDNDWCRYLETHKVVMINDDWRKPFTAESFEDKYQFRPSITGVCVWKACFGDGSDNIRGALQLKGLKQANQIKVAAFEYINYLGKHPDVNIDYILKKERTSSPLKELKTPEDKFFNGLSSFDPKYEVESTFFQNMKVIMSRCDDYKKFAVAKDVDDKFNLLIEKTLGFKVKESKQFKFGHIKG